MGNPSDIITMNASQHPLIHLFKGVPLLVLFIVGMLIFAVLSGGVAVLRTPDPSVLVTVMGDVPPASDGFAYASAVTRDGTQVRLLGTWAPRQEILAYPLDGAGAGEVYVDGEPPNATERFWIGFPTGAVIFVLIVGVSSMHYLGNTRRQSNQPWANDTD